MKTTTKKVMMYPIKELTIEGVNGAKTITNFSQSSGFNQYVTVNGGFIVDRNKTGSIDLYHELKETGVHDVLIEHYSKLFDLISELLHLIEDGASCGGCRS